MSACLHPINFKNLTRSHKFRYRFLSKISIHCDIDKNKLSDIIQYTFTQKGHLSVFGYNTHSEEFWAKKITNNEFMLHFTLSINSLGYENSNIIVTPIIGSDKEIKNLVHEIKEIINLYENSNFIKHCIDEKLIY
jgi:hypothetical protein